MKRKPLIEVDRLIPELMHGRDYEGDDPTGWHVTEKLDGVRCYWDGTAAWTKDGNNMELPPWIRHKLPLTPLDGELYAGLRNFEVVRRAVQYGQWKQFIRFVAFDKPDVELPWPSRIAIARRHYCNVLDHHICRSHAHLMDMLRDVQEQDGEGLMIHSPQQTGYIRSRTNLLLKVKHVLPLLT